MNEALYEPLQQTQQTQQASNPYAPYQLYDDNSSEYIRLLLKNDDLIKTFMLNMMGKVYDEDKQEWKQVKTPIITENGAEQLARLLSSVLNRNTTQSEITRDEALKITKSHAKLLKTDMVTNWNKYWLHKDDARFHYQYVWYEMMNYIQLALQRPVSGKEREIASGQTKTFINKSQFQQNQHLTQDSGFAIRDLLNRRR